MQSSAKTYILPMIREGILEFVRKLNSEQGFEKTLGMKAVT